MTPNTLTLFEPTISFQFVNSIATYLVILIQFSSADKKVTACSAVESA
jgi:hypothetical protein